jgi:hypothetical protein
MKPVLNWVVARLKEPSTWAGIALVAGAIGGALHGHTDQLASIVAGLLAMAIPEAGSAA